MKFLTIPRLQSLTSLLNHIDLGDQIVHCRLEAYSCKQAGDDKKLGKQLEKQWTDAINLSNQHYNQSNNQTSYQIQEQGDGQANGQSDNSSSNQTPELSKPHSSPPLHPIGVTSSPSLTAAMNQSLQQALNQSPLLGSSIKQPSPALHSLTPLQSPMFGPLSDSATRKLLVSLITTLNASFPDYDFSAVTVNQFTREPSPQLAHQSCKDLFLTSLETLHPGLTSEFAAAIDETIDLANCELYSYNPEDDFETCGQIWSRHFFLFNRREKKVLFITANACSKLHLEEDEDYEEINESLNQSMNQSSSAEDEYDESHGGLLFDDSAFVDQSILTLAHSHSMPVTSESNNQSNNQSNNPSTPELTRHESLESGSSKKKRSRTQALNQSNNQSIDQSTLSNDNDTEKKSKKIAVDKKTKKSNKQSNNQTKSKVVEIMDGQSDEEGGRSLLRRPAKKVA